ncbi:MAG: undecaprenyl-phosphate glucose phosphotransferase [Candidatus Aminicenantes bacterium]|nr:undecaprenyl-phosphate glucose phosphotransferase [Candidatus Aminicenantes bacterium]
MIKKQKTRLIGLFLLSDIVGILVSYFYSYGFRFYGYIIPVDPAKGIPPLKSYIAVFPLFLITHLVIFFIQGFYKSRLKRTKIDDFLYITLNVVLTIIIVLAILNYLYAYSQGRAPLFSMTFKISHLFLAVYFIVVIFMISFLRNQIYFFMKRRYAKGLNLRNVLIIGAGEMGRTVAQKLSQYKDLGFSVKGFLDDEKKPGEEIPVDGGIKVFGPLKELESVLEKEEISDVYVALDLSNYGKILEVFKVVNKYMVNVRLIPDLFQLLTLKATIEDLDGFPVISIDEPPMRGLMLLIKKLGDYIASFVLFILLLPLMTFVAILIKLTSKGPVFYYQERVGMDGKKFKMHKFRTMVYNAEEKTGPVMSQPGDSRVTRLGKFLRKFSIDEIPQLINVLKGEMSLIGPRPERPVFVKDFIEKIPKYMLRHKVKSGITGWAQVHGLRQDTPIDKRLEYDFYYIQNWSVALDLKILWKTLKKGFIDKNL